VATNESSARKVELFRLSPLECAREIGRLSR